MGGIVRTAEGGIDWTQDYFQTPCSLNVSGQIHAECYACALSNVYTFGPSFRLACHALSWGLTAMLMRAYLTLTCRPPSVANAKQLYQWLVERREPFARLRSAERMTANVLVVLCLPAVADSRGTTRRLHIQPGLRKATRAAIWQSSG